MSAVSSESAAEKRAVRWGAALIASAVLAVYANSVAVPFLFDDTVAVLGNPTIRELGSWAVLQPPTDGSASTGRPLVNLTLALNYAFGGERVFGYHVMNGALHVIAALALFGLVRRTLAPIERWAGTRAITRALVVALLWAVHPLHTETVVTVAQRTELLGGVIILLTLYAFARGWLALAVGLCAVGMTAKEIVVVTPVLVLLHDRTFRAGSFKAALQTRPRFYAALAATWLVLLALLVQGRGTRGVAAGFGLGVSSWSYLLTQAEAIVTYLRLSVWPHPLVLDYGSAVARSLGEVILEGAFVVALLTWTGWALVRRPALGWLGASFFLILAPSSSVVPLVTQTIAEHRMYLPLAAVIVALVLLAERLLARGRVWVTAAVVASLGVATVARNLDYQDAVRIWRDTVAKRPDNARAHNNLAWSLQDVGRTDEANRHYARAIELNPSYVSARYNWGVALLAQQREADALVQLETVVRLAPDHVDARVNLGTTLVRLGRFEEAIGAYESALRLNSAADVHYNLGVAWLARGGDLQAAAAFGAALQRDPQLADARFQLGRLAERQGQAAAAEAHYEATLQLAPAHAGAHARLGLLCARTNRLSAAAGHFQAVLGVAPDDFDALANLGNVLLLLDQPRPALELYERALRLRPNDARMRENIQLARQALR